MKLKQISIICVVLAAFFLFGWLAGRHNGKQSVETTKPADLTGFVSAVDMEKNMTEVKPDTIFVPVPVYIEKEGHDHQQPATTEKLVPLETIESGPGRNEALTAAATDWNLLRKYSGILFDDPTRGKVTYSFPVQFNKAGQIDYHYEPTPIPVIKQRIRLRPTIGGEAYSNGQYSFGGGVQYGAFGLNVRALRLPKPEMGRAFGVGLQIVF